MLPVMVTGSVLLGSGRLVWETATLRRVAWGVRLAIAAMPVLAAGVAVAWPIGIRAALGLDMSG
jgi:hypothetical protein